MRSLLYITTAVFSLSSALAADTAVTVSAGEHDGYSRIVVTGGDAGVAIETAGRSVRIRNMGAEAAIDLSDINDRQKAFRVDHARQIGAGAIELQLNCDCSVQTARTASGKVIIDIANSSLAYAETKPETPPKPAQSPSKTSSNTLDDTLTVEQARDRMMELLEKAASDGLVNFKNKQPAAKTASAPATMPAETATQAPTDLTSIIKPEQAQQPTESPEPQPALSPTLASASTDECLSDNMFSIDGSDFEEHPLTAIEDLQLQLIDAQGAEKHSILRRLANGFLSIGFGEEALAALENKEKATPTLWEIAQIVAERPLNPNGVILGAENCTGAQAFWQAAATDGPKAPVYFEQSGAAVETLPSRLRTLMATRLAIKMVDLDAWEAAQSLYDIAVGEDDAVSAELKFVEARLADHNTNSDASRNSLLEIATQQSSVADEALLALADSYTKQGVEPHEGFLEDIGALARLGGSSRAAFFEAYSWASIGNFEAAMLLLKNETVKPDGDAEMAGASADAMIIRALSGNDPLTKRAALEAYLTHADWIDPKASRAELRTLAADFASEIGLPNLGYELLSEMPGAPDKKRNAELAAAALTAGAPKSAIKLAAPYASEPAFGEILVEAHIAQQDYDAALATATAITDDKKKMPWKARSGWLSRNWEAAYDGFRGTDPNTLDKAAAIRFALSAYKNGASSLPSAVDAALASQADAVKAGLNSLFQTSVEGTQLQRARALSNATAKEIVAFEELLSDG